ncbi:MAG: hypothetical protein AB4372_18955 [Xenococcus sp. (in: cyanobacteria)]
MKSSLLGASLAVPLFGATLFGFYSSASAFTFSAGSELQIDANLILDGSGDVKFVPKVGTSTTPPTPAEPGEYGIFGIGTGTNLGDFAVYNIPNAPLGTNNIQGEILSFQVNPLTLEVQDLPLVDFLILPAVDPEPSEVLAGIAPIPASTFTITDLTITGINQIGTLVDGITPVFSSFDINGDGFFTSEGTNTPARLEFTTQGFFSEDLDGDGLISPDELDTDGSISGTIITDEVSVPEPTSILSLLICGSLIGSGAYKNKFRNSN